MGRDQARVLICAAASLALILAGAVIMDWYHLALDGITAAGKVAIDLRTVHVCGPDHACVSQPLTQFSGMFPTLAAVTLWSSVGFAALVVFQAGARLLTGSAYDSFTKLGYMLALMAISLAVATAYLFGPEPEAASFAGVSPVGISLYRTWAPLTLIAGLSIGLAAIYLAVARESSDLGAAYKPVTIDPAKAPAKVIEARARSASVPIPVIARELTGVLRTTRPSDPPPVREPTGVLRAARSPTGAPPVREPTGVLRAVQPPADPSGLTQPGVGPVAAPPRTKSGPLPPIPEHLRNRLHYVALTVELTSGGIDARREDGLSRIVLWRDLVGVVARRMPPEYDGAAFVDIVSIAGSTLRIVPWTRLTGEPIAAEGDSRPRAVVEHIVARCPGIKLDPATRQFLEAGEPAQLPDLDTLRAHDAHLA